MNEKILHPQPFNNYLDDALSEAEKAYKKEEVPVGAIIVQNNHIIAKAHNLKESQKDCTAHAEILAIKAAQDVLGDWRLSGCTLVSTLEPCLMCAGAILHARIDKVIYGAKDFKWGGDGSVLSLFGVDTLNHQVEAVYHSDERCEKLLKSFFQEKRKTKKTKL